MKTNPTYQAWGRKKKQKKKPQKKPQICVILLRVVPALGAISVCIFNHILSTFSKRFNDDDNEF